MSSLRTQIAGDLKTVIFNPDDFAEEAVHIPRGGTKRTAINGLYRKEYKAADPLNAHFTVTHSGPSFMFAEDSALPVKIGDTFLVDSETLYAIAIQKNRKTQATLAMLSKDQPQYVTD